MINLAIIPARSGSKGIKSKNIVKINNTTLLENTILQAKKFTRNENIFLSTDSEDYVNLTKYLNIKNNGLRPKKLSTDSSKIYDVINYELSLIKDNFLSYNIENKICIILEPSFYGVRNNISKLKKIYNSDPAIKSVFGVDSVPVKYNYLKQYYIDNSKVNFVGKDFKINRQDLPNTFIRSGSML